MDCPTTLRILQGGDLPPRFLGDNCCDMTGGTEMSGGATWEAQIGGMEMGFESSVNGTRNTASFKQMFGALFQVIPREVADVPISMDTEGSDYS